MAELVRVAALTGYLEAMAGFGIDPRPLLREQGLNAGQLANPEQLIPARAATRLLECSARAAGCSTLGLRMAEDRALANLGATSLLILNQPTLRHALAALTEYRARINSTLVLHIEEAGDSVILREDFSLRRPEPSRQSSDLALGVLVRLCKAVLGEDWTPGAVCFTHQPPSPADRRVFARVFQCSLQFDSEFNGIVIPTSDLDRRNVRANQDLADHARRLLEAVMRPDAGRIAQDVDQLVRLLLPSGRATIQTCAASLGLPVRTLQRMLEDEDETFSEVLERARMQLATQYLANPRIRVTDIAAMLGYGSTGAFSRWHVHAFGMPPLRRRRSLAVAR
ncbi:MAG: AraC family transcriptional regulator [Sphingomonadales bacterium]|nr:AraC family transcriptional regulator [Sphingomonadales bacterium]